jgi:hypothetical protein
MTKRTSFLLSPLLFMMSSSETHQCSIHKQVIGKVTDDFQLEKVQFVVPGLASVVETICRVHATASVQKYLAAKDVKTIS